MRLPSLNALKAFEATGRHLSMRDGARELCVTASAVSQLVRSLELELGTSLFERRHRALVLTRDGQDLLAAVRTAFRMIGDAASRIGRHRESGTVTICVTNFFAEMWLVPRLGDFHARHPATDLRVVTDSGLAVLTSGDADLAVRHGLGDYPGMLSDLLMAPPVVPVASPQLANGRQTPANPEDVLAWPLIHDADRGAWALWASHLGLRSTVPQNGPSYDDPALLRAAILAGQGVGLLPEPLIEPQIADGSLVAVGPAAAIPNVAYYLVTSRVASTRAAVRDFRAWMLGQFVSVFAEL